MPSSKPRNKCQHGRHKHQCKECGGSSICAHERQKSKCKECAGSSICGHGRQKHQCPIPGCGLDEERNREEKTLADIQRAKDMKEKNNLDRMREQFLLDQERDRLEAIARCKARTERIIKKVLLQEKASLSTETPTTSETQDDWLSYKATVDKQCFERYSYLLEVDLPTPTSSSLSSSTSTTPSVPPPSSSSSSSSTTSSTVLRYYLNSLTIF